MKLPAQLKKFWWLIGIVVVLILASTAFFLFTKQDSNKSSEKSNSSKNSDNANPSVAADQNSTDPVAKGKYLSNGNCSGEGSKKLNTAPMKATDISYIVPYGLMAGGHVTPIDHQYYWGKVPMGAPDTYDVLALGDGYLVDLTYRDRSSEGKTIKGDYRGVISYSCTFFSYFDLATSLHPDIAKQLPEGWDKSGHGRSGSINIPVKEGQVIAKFGGQSLDFAIWDTEKTLKNLLVPAAYNNAEPWKVNTVNPLDYFTEQVKNQILPLYLRKVAPVDGVIDQDVDGKAVGNWFAEGTNGYAGVFAYGPEGGGHNYWTGHLSIVRDHYDNDGWVFSHGSVAGEAKQFAIKNPSVTPDKLDASSGLVKYELAEWRHVDNTGSNWIGDKLPVGDLKFRAGNTQGVALVQMLENRKIKVEVFPGKTPGQVSAFTSAAKIYDRGDNAKVIESNTAT